MRNQSIESQSIRIIQIIIVVLFFIGSLISVYIFYKTDYKSVYNSDALYLPILFSDIFSKRGSISDWYLTPAPYFFPDQLIFLFSYLGGHSLHSRIFIFAILQVMFLFCAVWLITKCILKASGFIGAIVITIGLIWCAISIGKPFSFLFVSAFHYGTFISEIIIIALWLRYNITGGDILLILICLLSYLLSLSDGLFIIQGVVPIIATSIILDNAVQQISSKRILSLVMFAASSIFGYISYPIFVVNETRPRLTFRFSGVLSNIADTCFVFQTVLVKSIVYDLVFAIYIVLIGYTIYSFILNPAIKKGHLTWLTLFSFFSLTVTVMTIILIHHVAPRYFIPAFSWPIIILFLSFASRTERDFSLLIIIVSGLVFTFLATNTCKLIQKWDGLSVDFYPDEISCIDTALEKTGLRNGIAQYWDAKYVQALSKLDLNIAQYTNNLSERRWITSKRYFKKDYDFAIISENARPSHTIPLETLFAINGRPIYSVRCSKKTLHIFGKDKLHVVPFNPTVISWIRDNYYPVGKILTFAQGGMGVRYAVSGWSYSEPWGIWSDGNEAWLVFRLEKNPEKNLALKLTGHAFVTDRHPLQQVEVVVNGNKVADLRYEFPARTETRTIVISKKLIQDRWMRIQFRFKNPASPTGVGVNTDTRRLGLGLMAMQLDELGIEVDL